MRGREILKGGCCSPASGANQSLAMWQPPGHPFLFSTGQQKANEPSNSTRLTGGHFHTRLLDLCSASLFRATSLWSPVRKCKPSAERVQPWELRSRPAGSRPKPGLWWARSSDETQKFYEVVGIKHLQRGGHIVGAVIHAHEHWCRNEQRA